MTSFISNKATSPPNALSNEQHAVIRCIVGKKTWCQQDSLWDVYRVVRSVPLLVFLAPYPFNKYKFSIKILSSSVKVILFIYITTVVCQGACLPWKPCSWYSTRTKLFEVNQSATEWRCLVWKIIMGELILMNLCRPALGVQFFWDTVYVNRIQMSKVKRPKLTWRILTDSLLLQLKIRLKA